MWSTKLASVMVSKNEMILAKCRQTSPFRLDFSETIHRHESMVRRKSVKCKECSDETNGNKNPNEGNWWWIEIVQNYPDYQKL